MSAIGLSLRERATTHLASSVMLRSSDTLPITSTYTSAKLLVCGSKSRSVRHLSSGGRKRLEPYTAELDGDLTLVARLEQRRLAVEL